MHHFVRSSAGRHSPYWNPAALRAGRSSGDTQPVRNGLATSVQTGTTISVSKCYVNWWDYCLAPSCQKVAVRMPKLRASLATTRIGARSNGCCSSRSIPDAPRLCDRSGWNGSQTDVLSLEDGSLYPALHRIERRGRLPSVSAVTETGRRARFYRLTRSDAQVAIEADTGQRLTLAVRGGMDG